MRSVSLLLLTTLLLGGVAGADETTDYIYVPDDRRTGASNVAPMCGQWPPGKNPFGEWRYQLHLDKSMIGRSVVIRDIAFFSTDFQALSVASLEIRMSHTTLSKPSTSFDANLLNPVTVFPLGTHSPRQPRCRHSRPGQPLATSRHRRGGARHPRPLRGEASAAAPPEGGHPCRIHPGSCKNGREARRGPPRLPWPS